LHAVAMDDAKVAEHCQETFFPLHVMHLEWKLIYIWFYRFVYNYVIYIYKYTVEI
jgi:hypothetical protein